MKISELLDGTLLGDAGIRVWKSKYGNYFYYKLSAKDKMLLKWHKKLFQKFEIDCYIGQDNKISKTSALGFYMNKYRFLLDLREKWYKQENGKTQKIIPRDLKLTPTTLLFWYLGDGSLIRRKNDVNRVPFVVLATNAFSKKDVDFLIQKLKELDLNFYAVKYKSGFTGKDCGYCLYSNTQDGTPFRFFKLIDFECPKEITKCSTGSKGIYKEEKFFKDKWPKEEDWIKILSNVKEVGAVLREKRLQLSLSQSQLGKKIKVRRETVRDLELARRNFSVRNFRKILNELGINPQFLLDKLLNGNGKTFKDNKDIN